MVPIRADVERLLHKGKDAKVAGVSGSCEDILEHREALWTFVDRCDVEPTNNHGERELRSFVIWRKTSLGTQSQRGNLFDFVTATYAAFCAGRPQPSLFT